MTLNAAASRAAKEAGQQLAIDFASDWKDAVLLELRGWLAIHRAKGHTTMTMEQFRSEARAQPTSHKAWGSLPGIACRAGLIAPLTHSDGSAVMRPAASVKTHAHPVRVWSLVDFFPVATAGANSPSVIEAADTAEVRQSVGVVRVGEGRRGLMGGAAA